MLAPRPAAAPILPRLRKQLRARALARDRTSVAALELAIVLPLLLALLAGVYDLSELVIIRAEIYAAVESMASSASSLAAANSPDGGTALTYDQVQEVESLIWADVPSLRDGQKVNTPLSITMSSLLFYPYPNIGCKFNGTTACNYIADVVWSESYTGTKTGAGATFDYTDPTTQVNNADCNTLTANDQVTPGTVLSGYQNVTTFPTLAITTSNALAQPNGTLADDVGVTPILAMSIQYTYQPLFTLYLPVSDTFWVDAYWPVRSVANAAVIANNGQGNTVEPLVNEFTAMIGTPPSTPAGTDVTSGAYCINTGVRNPYALESSK